MIDMDKYRKTYRSNVKKRSGGRLPGLEMFHQGRANTEVNIARGPLPIISRSGLTIRHDYDEVQAVYRTAVDENYHELEKIIDLTININPTTSTFINGESDFSQLENQFFDIYNPEYAKDPTLPQYWRFRFTGTQALDPRWIYSSGYLYSGYQNVLANAAGGFNAMMRLHPLNPYSPIYQESSFDAAAFVTENNVTLGLYGASSNTGFEIPIGFPTNAFPSGQKIGGVNSSNEDTIDPATFDLTQAAVYQQLASNPYWLTAAITRSLKNVLPSYMEVVNPLDTQTLGLESSGTDGLWDIYDFGVNGFNSNVPLKIKIKYKNIATSAWTQNNNLQGTDLTLGNWNLTKVYKWVKEGYRALPKDPEKFYEGFRTDFLKQTFIRPVENNVADIRYYPATVSSGTSVPPIASGVEISKYEEQLEAYTATQNLEVQSEVIQIRKSQSPESLYNTRVSEYTWYEDVHYHDPDGQFWSHLQTQWPQWVKLSDHGREELAFVEHVRNLLDYRYTPVRLIEEHPMSGRLDVLNSFRSYYENMPEAVLWNTKRCTGIQSFELDSITVSVDKYKKKSEEIDVKKFEDVRGKRNPGLIATDYAPDGSLTDETSVMFVDYFDQEEPEVLDYVEEERWSRIDDEMMIWLTQRYWDHDSNTSTAEIQTGRNIEIDRREWQQSDYLYANTGHTTVHFQRVNGIVSQEHKR